MINEQIIIGAIESGNIEQFNSKYDDNTINHSLLRDISLDKIIKMGSLVLVNKMIKYYSIDIIEQYLCIAEEYPQIHDILCEQRDSILKLLKEDQKMKDENFIRDITYNRFSKLAWEFSSVSEEIYLKGLNIAIEKKYLDIVNLLVNKKDCFVPRKLST